MNEDKDTIVKANGQNPVLKVLKVIWKINVMVLRGILGFFAMWFDHMSRG